MKRIVAVLFLVAWAGVAVAQDKPNPTGTWKYQVDAGGQMFDVVIKLKLDGDKLTGTITVADQETKIEDAKYKDGKVSFKASPDFGGNTIRLKYEGTVKGDTFKGKREMDRDGQTNTRDFEAKRVKE